MTESEHYAYNTMAHAIRVALYRQFEAVMRDAPNVAHKQKPTRWAIWGQAVELSRNNTNDLLINGQPMLDFIGRQLTERAALRALESYKFNNSPRCTWVQGWRAYKKRYGN